MPDTKRRILIVEDAEGIASLYEQLLKDQYDLTICHSGREAQALIDQEKKFDMTIIDIVLPPEEEGLTLDDCQSTGLRLMNAMLRREMCSRFYVITVLKDAKPNVEKLCQEAKAVVKFQYKLDSEFDELLANVESLLEQTIA
jgi:CheY-like chemotaxis protein